MQYILSEEEMDYLKNGNRYGCELINVWETDDMTLDCAYEEQETLNKQGYFTMINCTDAKKELYRIQVFQRT